MTPDRQDRPDVGLCPMCQVGRLRDTRVTWVRKNEVKTLIACDECSYTEERNAEPDHGEGPE